MNFAQQSTAKQREMLLTINAGISTLKNPYYASPEKAIQVAIALLKSSDADVLTIQEVLDDQRLWNGYQHYNHVMRGYQNPDYRYRNQTEIAQIRESIIGFQTALTA